MTNQNDKYINYILSIIESSNNPNIFSINKAKKYVSYLATKANETKSPIDKIDFLAANMFLSQKVNLKFTKKILQI